MDLRHPFTRAEGYAAGLTDRDFRRQEVVSLFRNVWIAADVELTPRVLAAAALRAVPAGSFLCHRTAGILLGSGAEVAGVVDVGSVGDQRSRLSGIESHRYREPPETMMLGRLPVTSPAQTFVDLAATCSLVELVTTGDQLVASRRTTPRQLMAVADGARTRGARTARQAARLVRPGVESRMETAARLLLVLAGLPEPVVNLRVQDGSGRARRVDLGYPEFKVAVEYDGRHHIERETQWRNDIVRREDIEALGWRFIVLTSADVFVTPGRSVDRVAAVLRSRGAVVTPRSTWRLHFAGRPQAS
ncbi:endonuclease domain-containing protein [Demetria terragena]|uniref:endonuclease domain-containing protein n=1 Tax=Demetria terragena TaxID=63959 RepID=UPI0006871263|nr:hypothetical protein [Demetria terragena]